MFNFFGRKKGVETLKEEIKESFDNVKKDFGKAGKWIKHLDEKQVKNASEIKDLHEQILSMHNDLIEIKEFISFFGPSVSKQAPTKTLKRTESVIVQTPVQTPVQTDILDSLTVMERAIVWALLNSEMKLSHEDLAALLGKNKSTIRGQINSIKQKSSGLIRESRESTGKKRLYVPEEVRSEVVKDLKVRVKKEKGGKNRKSES